MSIEFSKSSFLMKFRPYLYRPLTNLPSRLALSVRLNLYYSQVLSVAITKFYKALRTVMESEDWENYLIEGGISAYSAKNYVATFASEGLTMENYK